MCVRLRLVRKGMGRGGIVCARLSPCVRGEWPCSSVFVHLSSCLIACCLVRVLFCVCGMLRACHVLRCVLPCYRVCACVCARVCAQVLVTLRGASADHRTRNLLVAEIVAVLCLVALFASSSPTESFDIKVRVLAAFGALFGADDVCVCVFARVSGRVLPPLE